MIYNNLIFFLVVIFAISTATTPSEPGLAPWYGLPLFALLLFVFYRIAGAQYRRALQGGSKAYFATEKKLSILAVILFITAYFTFDLKYYLQPLSFGKTMPALVDLAGLSLFILFLSLMWMQARHSYRILFQRSYSAAEFVFSNIKANLPIVLPWLILSLCFDLLTRLPFPAFQKLLQSGWGDLVFFLLFVVFLALFFPPIVRRLWNCTPMETGQQRAEIEEFCHSQNFSSDILYWPLFEGRVLTAGIMGMIPKFRYLLLTPALLAVLDKEELESVLAHEIGHVKRYHLMLYVLLFLGFSLLAGGLAEPLPYLFLSSEWFYRLLAWTPLSADDLLAFLGALTLLLVMVIYFRFLFGYFIRNFERQADLYVFKAQGSSFPLIRSFEKIAAMSGNIRDQKNWHHFGIGERIDFLEECETDRARIKRHHRKVYISLVLYFILISISAWSLHQVDVDAMAKSHEPRFAQAYLEQKLKKEPENSRWLQLQGDLMLSMGKESEAALAYDQAFNLSPVKADLANNLAWLLLTAQDRSLRNPARALTLARAAARQETQGYILDTLATALWANGQVDEAVHVEVKAARMDPKNLRYYRAQAEKFRLAPWDG